MENVLVIGILAAMALACEWWLRRKGAESRRASEDSPRYTLGDRLPATYRVPIGEVPFEALGGRLSATPRPPSASAN